MEIRQGGVQKGGVLYDDAIRRDACSELRWQMVPKKGGRVRHGTEYRLVEQVVRMVKRKIVHW